MIDRTRIATLPFLAALPLEARHVIADRAVERTFPAGTILFRAGDPAVGMMVVLSGKVRVMRHAGARAQVMHVEGPGGTLGEVPVFAGGGYPATAVAAEQTVCAVIDRETLVAALRRQPDAAFVLLERLARRIRVLVERLDRATLRPVSARLAEFLVTRADRRGRSVIAIGMTQAQLAEELGTVREVIVRELHALRRLGILRPVGSGRYDIIDIGALRERADADVGDRTVRSAGGGQKVKRQDSESAPSAAGTGTAPRKMSSTRLPGR